MKKLSTIIIALSLVLSLTQCKKTETPTEGWVHITMKVDGGDRHIVYPNTGAVMYSEGDIVYVGNNNHYIGYLTFHDGTFSGDIYSPSSSDYLHFYFLGGHDITGDLITNLTGSTTLDIANQHEKLPVLSYGHSKNKYDSNNVDYYCLLRNKCALVKFGLDYATSSNVYVNHIPTTALINFADPEHPITSENNDGAASLYSENGTTKWAILLPETDLSSAEAYIGTSTTPFNITINGTIEITNNGYITSGITINNQYVCPAGAIDGLFTINNTGKKVYFSQGNLQATTSDLGDSWTWSFAENQYDIIGNDVANTKINGSMKVSENGTVDLFGWNGESSSYYNYGIYHGSSANQYGTIAGENLKDDWGHNAISNGGNVADTWYTLSSEEWLYVLNTRTTVSGMRYAKATVNDVTGLILLPDNWSTSTYALNTTTNSFDANVIDATSWTTLQSAGAVFLPNAGFRIGTTINDGGYYLSRTSDGDPAYSMGIYLSKNGFSQTILRRNGCSVRLVRNVE